MQMCIREKESESENLGSRDADVRLAGRLTAAAPAETKGPLSEMRKIRARVPPRRFSGEFFVKLKRAILSSYFNNN
jgi:hypothetical protein